MSVNNNDPIKEEKKSEFDIGKKDVFAWVGGTGLVLLILYSVQSASEGGSNFYPGILFVLLILLPILIFIVVGAAATKVVEPENYSQYFSKICEPAIVVGCVVILFFVFQQGVRGGGAAREIKEAQAIKPGGVQFVALSKDGLPEDQIDARWSFQLKSMNKMAAAESELFEIDYDGYKLTENNKLIADAYGYSGVGLTKSLFIPQTDYTAIEPLVRIDGGGEKANPPNAWLWPRQVNTLVYVYKDHIETAPFVSHLDETQEIHATLVKLSNFTGKDLMRIKVNGWSLPYQDILRSRRCDSVEAHYIPTIIGQNLLLEWQVDGDEKWYSLASNTLPAEPKVPNGKFRRSQGIEVLLGPDKTMAVRRKVMFDEKEKEYLTTPNEVFGQELPSFAQFKQDFIGCIPKIKGWPQDIALFNLTTRTLKDADGIFGTILANERKRLHAEAITKVFEQSFIGYKLKPQLQVELQDKDPTIKPRKITIPQPDYTKIKQFLAQYPNVLTTDDFRLEVFVYPESVESAFVFSRIGQLKDEAFVDLHLVNRTGRTITRLQINGLEIAVREGYGSQYGFLCGDQPWFFSVPAMRDTNLVRWQYAGSREWHSANVVAQYSTGETRQSKSSVFLPWLYLKADAQLLHVIKYGVDENGYLDCKKNDCAVINPKYQEVKGFLLNAKKCIYEKNDNM
ncbi:hypothetical protein [Chitinibacter sp. ZOR0017]|uniref:hypothetical protein n=1 Tax=Chitinibacter sp. ZOR0017 TaxID=1339254 RepID=UPI000646E025|nr:hypothetical protein [Chitinibacter sp. ZOR0017]